MRKSITLVGVTLVGVMHAGANVSVNSAHEFGKSAWPTSADTFGPSVN